MNETRSRYRPRDSDQPIIINGVTYRSPEEIPENLRPLWDDFERNMEEGDFPFGGTPPLPPRHEPKPQPAITLSSTAIFLISLFGALALAGYGMFYDDPSLIFPAFSGWLIVAFVVLLGPWAYMLVRNRLIRGWKPKRDGLVLLGIGLYCAFLGAFHGVAKLLHHVDNEPGEMVGTVSGKYGYSRKHCAHFTFREFRFLGDRVCASGRFYDEVKVGDRILIKGQLSHYGLYPYGLELLERE